MKNEKEMEKNEKFMVNSKLYLILVVLARGNI